MVTIDLTNTRITRVCSHCHRVVYTTRLNYTNATDSYSTVSILNGEYACSCYATATNDIYNVKVLKSDKQIAQSKHKKYYKLPDKFMWRERVFKK